MSTQKTKEQWIEVWFDNSSGEWEGSWIVSIEDGVASKTLHAVYGRKEAFELANKEAAARELEVVS